MVWVHWKVFCKVTPHLCKKIGISQSLLQWRVLLQFLHFPFQGPRRQQVQPRQEQWCLASLSCLWGWTAWFRLFRTCLLLPTDAQVLCTHCEWQCNLGLYLSWNIIAWNCCPHCCSLASENESVIPEKRLIPTFLPLSSLRFSEDLEENLHQSSGL